jgi:hypothetical protein
VGNVEYSVSVFRFDESVIVFMKRQADYIRIFNRLQEFYAEKSLSDPTWLPFPNNKSPVHLLAVSHQDKSTVGFQASEMQVDVNRVKSDQKPEVHERLFSSGNVSEQRRPVPQV